MTDETDYGEYGHHEPSMVEYWTIISLKNREMLGILESEDEDNTDAEAVVVSREFGEQSAYWLWGDEITKAEFETYCAFGITEVKITPEDLE